MSIYTDCTASTKLSQSGPLIRRAWDRPAGKPGSHLWWVGGSAGQGISRTAPRDSTRSPGCRRGSRSWPRPGCCSLSIPGRTAPRRTPWRDPPRWNPHLRGAPRPVDAEPPPRPEASRSSTRARLSAGRASWAPTRSCPRAEGAGHCHTHRLPWRLTCRDYAGRTRE